MWFRWGRKQSESLNNAADGDQRFQLLSGRLHSTQAPYVLPTDEREIRRLNFQHHMLRLVMQGNFAAPIRQPRDILDVGSGSGRWAIEMAQQFPHANVIGVDLVTAPMDTAAQQERLPDNYLFVEGNILEGIAFAHATFDFVHQRCMMWAIPAHSWQNVVNELVRVTRPGGGVELMEASPVTGAPALDMMRDWQVQLAQTRGIDILIGSKIHTFLERAGLRPVIHREVPVPFGPHGGRIGRMAESNYLGIMEALRGPLSATGIASPQDVDDLIQTAHAEATQNTLMHTFYLAYGQVPVR